MNRRDFLKYSMMASTGMIGTKVLSATEPVIEVLNDTSLSEYNGFNYQPSYARHGLDVWVDLNRRQIDYEIKKGKELFPEMKSIRIWLSMDAYWKEPKKMPGNVSTVIDICGQAGLKVIPVMTSGWHGVPDFGGVSPEIVNYPLSLFLPYYDAVMLPHKGDGRILGWDLCNEPFQSGGQERFIKWLDGIHSHVKSRGPEFRLTIGTSGDRYQGKTQIEVLHAFCDFFSIHPYFPNHAGLNAYVAVANRYKKPLMATECAWGALDDHRRAGILKHDLSLFKAHKIAFLIHAMWHSGVADLHRPGFGPVCPPGYMGCIELNGTIRPEHEIIRKYL